MGTLLPACHPPDQPSNHNNKEEYEGGDDLLSQRGEKRSAPCGVERPPVQRWRQQRQMPRQQNEGAQRQHRRHQHEEESKARSAYTDAGGSARDDAAGMLRAPRPGWTDGTDMARARPSRSASTDAAGMILAPRAARTHGTDVGVPGEASQGMLREPRISCSQPGAQGDASGMLQLPGVAPPMAHVGLPGLPLKPPRGIDTSRGQGLDDPHEHPCESAGWRGRPTPRIVMADAMLPALRVH